MVEAAAITNSPVAVQVEPSSTTTVPSDETWYVDIGAYNGDSDTTVDGTSITFKDSAPVVLPSGTSITTSSGDGNQVMISGYDVAAGSHTVDHSVTFKAVPGNGSYSVPAGETHRVLVVSEPTEINLNGAKRFRAPNNGIPMVLPENSTLNSMGGTFLVSGWVV